MHFRSFVLLSVATAPMAQASFWKAGFAQELLANVTGRAWSDNMIYSEATEQMLERKKQERLQAPQSQGYIRSLTNIFYNEPKPEVDLPAFRLYTELCKEHGGAIKRFGARVGRSSRLTKIQRKLEFHRILAEEEAAEHGISPERLNYLAFDSRKKTRSTSGSTTVTTTTTTTTTTTNTVVEEPVEPTADAPTEEPTKPAESELPTPMDDEVLDILDLPSVPTKKDVVPTTTTTETDGPAPGKPLSPEEGDALFDEMFPVKPTDAVAEEAPKEKDPETSPAEPAKEETPGAADAIAAEELPMNPAPPVDTEPEVTLTPEQMKENSRLVMVLSQKEKTTANVTAIISKMAIPEEDAQMLKKLAKAKPAAAYRVMAREYINIIKLRPNPPVRFPGMTRRTVTNVRVYKNGKVPQAEPEEEVVEDDEVVAPVAKKADKKRKRQSEEKRPKKKARVANKEQ